MVLSFPIGQDLVCILVMCVLLVSQMCSTNRSESQRELSGCFLAITIFVLTDLVWNAHDLHVIRFTQHTLCAIAIVNYCSVGLAGYFWLRFFLSESGRHAKDIPTYMKTVIAFPVIVIVIVSLASLETGWLFTVDAYGNYSRGDMFFVQVLMCMLPIVGFLFASLAMIRKSRNMADKRKFLTLTSFSIPVLGFSLFQVVYPDYILMSTGLILAVLLVITNLQNQMITRDDLTGLNNRFMLEAHLRDVFDKCKKDHGVSLYVTVMDLDRFKVVVDRFGHDEGSKAIRRVAQLLNEAVGRTGAFLAVFGGDEYVMVTVTEDPELVDRICARIDELLEEETSRRPYTLHLSKGTVKMTDEHTSHDQLFKQADAAMFANKQKYYESLGYGRGGYVPMKESDVNSEEK